MTCFKTKICYLAVLKLRILKIDLLIDIKLLAGLLFLEKEMHFLAIFTFHWLLP